MNNSGSFISLKDIFEISNAGIKTDRDDLFIDIDREQLTKRMEQLFSGKLGQDFIERYKVKDSGSYKLTKKLLGKHYLEEYICQIHYRPFDIRWIYYDPTLISRPAYQVMKELIPGDNYSLSLKRQSKFDFSYAFIHRNICESCLFESAYANNTEFPLYHHIDAFGKVELKTNISTSVIKLFEKNTGKVFSEKSQSCLSSNTFNSLDVLDYIYAILYSNKYRIKYAELLKIDFPRIPLPTNGKIFDEMKSFGKELRSIHVEENFLKEQVYGLEYNGVFGEEIQTRKYKDGRVFINKKSYIEKIPENIWNYCIGGYQLIEKYLKDRNHTRFSEKDLLHISNLAVTIQATITISEKIDKSDIINELI